MGRADRRALTGGQQEWLRHQLGGSMEENLGAAQPGATSPQEEPQTVEDALRHELEQAQREATENRELYLRALEMVLDHRIAASAIDSTVLELEWRARPKLQAELRVIASLGPSPIPPWVVSRSVPPDLRQAIRGVFWRMHETAEGRAILERGLIEKMVRVEDRDYDPIREMARIADQVTW